MASISSLPACGSVSLPCSPDSDFSCPPVSYCEPCTAPRRRSSISRARENIRKTSTKVQKQFERKLLQMAELHMDVPLPLHGAPGVVYHVVDLPKDHSRDTVIEILDQSIQWLRTNKDGSTSPFISTNNSKSDSSDLLTSDTGFFDLPPLEPSMSQGASSPKSFQEVKSIDCQVEEDEDVFADFQGTGNPTPIGTLIDLEPQPIPDSLTPGKVSPPPIAKKDVHPDLASLISFFEKQATTSTQQSTSAPRIPKALQIQRPSPQKKGEDQDFPSEKARMTQTETTIRNSGTPTFQPYRPTVPREPRPAASTTTIVNLNAASARRSSLCLSAGIRPVLPTSLTITPAPPATAPSSTEFLDRRKNSARLLGLQESRRGKARTRQDDSMLDTLQLLPSQAPVTQPTQLTRSNRMAERISLFEKPLPELPTDLTGKTRTLKRSTKRLGIYGAPQLTDTISPRTKYTPPKDDKKQPFGEFNPYRPSPTPPQPPTTTVTPPSLPPVPHVKKGSMLQEIKNELFASSGQRSSIRTTKTSSTISTIMTNISLLQYEATAQDSTTISHEESQPTASYLNPNTQASCLPYSPTQIRKGTLKALGGKVVEIRKQFETETESTTVDMPLFSRTQDQLGSKQRRASYRHHEIPSRTSSALRTYTHSAERNAHQRDHHASSTTNPPTSRNRNSHLETPHYRSQADRDAIALETRHRLIAAADEADFAASWRRAVDTGRDSEVIRKLDFAIIGGGSGAGRADGSGASSHRRRDREWEWKRFVDVEWDDRERERQSHRRERARETDRHRN